MPQQMPIGPPTPSPSPHLQLLQNGQQLLPSMLSVQSQGLSQPQSHHPQQQQGLPNMPLQIAHLPNQIGLQNPSNNPANNNTMTMPPPSTNGHHMQHNGHHNPHPNNHSAPNQPQPNQILQQLHQNSGVINGGNGGGVVGPGNNGMTAPQNGMDANNNVVAGGGGGSDEGNRWTQFQVQQLWRHHAYLNGNVMGLTGQWVYLIVRDKPRC